MLAWAVSAGWLVLGEWSMMTVRSLHSRTPMTTARNDAVPTLKLSSLSSVALAQAAAYPTVYLLSVAPIVDTHLRVLAQYFQITATWLLQSREWRHSSDTKEWGALSLLR